MNSRGGVKLVGGWLGWLVGGWLSVGCVSFALVVTPGPPSPGRFAFINTALYDS